MQLCSYLSLSRHGVYYFRYPLQGHQSRKRRTARLSLRTRCPQTAQLYARQLGGYYAALKDEGALQVMDSEEIKSKVAEYFDDLFRYRIENIDKNGFSADDRRGYKDAIKHLKADMRQGNAGALDLFTPVDEFRAETKISASEWAAISEAVLPLLREHSASQLEQIIDYGDKKNGISVDMTMRGQQALVVQQQQTSQNEIALPDAIKAFLDQRRALGKVGNKHIEAQESELALLCEIVGQDKLVSAFDGSLVRHVRDTLIALPKNRDKDDAISDLHILEAVSVEGVERITIAAA